MNSGVQIILMDLMLFPHAELEQSVLPNLHAEEQARYLTFKHPLRRRTWLAGRMLTLSALAQRTGNVDAKALRTDQEGGIRYQSGNIRISLSHSHDLVAVALSEARVGVDVEWPRSRKLIHRYEEVYSGIESEQLRELQEADLLHAFYRLWTLKEAACKAAGVPLWETLRSTHFDLANRAFSSSRPFPSGCWYFMAADIEPDWHLAVATGGVQAAPQIECRRMLASGHFESLKLAHELFLQGQ